MPESEYTDDASTVAAKKRRLPGACDICRKKKIKCDSATMPSGRCSNCIAFDSKCMHTDPVKKRGPKTNYVEELEQRVNKLEEMLKELKPEVVLPEDEAFREYSPVQPQHSPPSLQYSRGESSSPRQLSEPSDSAEDDLPHIELLEHMKRMSLHTFGDRYFGPSSSFSLVKSAMSIKTEFMGNEASLSVPDYHQYFELQPWERETAELETPHYVFPDDDLILSLVDIYFNTINIIFPMLHRPTFDKNVAEGLHLRDHNFGAALLLVLAIASRYSNDPRVYSDPNAKLSSGWKFFEQMGVIYSLGTSVPQFGWTMVGIGMRFAVEIGLHRRKPEGHQLTVEDELKKRAFWALITLDRLISLFLGRPSIIRDEDFDLETPVECDDEYWEIEPNGRVHFHQPPNTPSKITYFRLHLKLCEILAFVLRTLYSIKKSRAMLGLTGKDWEQRLVADLDSSLNAWVDSIPDHLRWDPHRKDSTFLFQSAALYCMYYMLQIQIHRPFLHTDSPLSFPSLAICTNAARSCSHVVDVHCTTNGTVIPHIIMGAFVSGVVLSMNIWSGKRAGLSLNLQKELADVEKCKASLKYASERWNIAGRLWDMLNGISTVGNASLEEDSTSKKRARENDISVYLTGPAPAVRAWDSYEPIPTSSFSAQISGTQQYFDENLTPSANQVGAIQVGDAFNFQASSHPETSFSGSSTYSDFGLLEEVGNNTINMWTGAPAGFDWAEWNTYITNLEPTYF
ncbi:fungal-specific transcription factor domain-containing protein [Desarmillaria tabescens]|uniref:Fungal-specific transcription factor domain-containing protein n=1 Tax=Armillaria tabescens TaxID=1929756 RepID=A0AA39TJI0_ARMTA|nr:fungal-specific transcription factor domain-containing protein [Desarmillaria tabescens]KAK0461277.1 fungal-specific transcription factor domain-containing protein [Desarmillaria tabescens]